MHFHCQLGFENRKKADALVLPYRKGKKRIEIACTIDKTLSNRLSHVLSSGDLTGKEGELLFHYIEGLPETRIVFLGLGDGQDDSGAESNGAGEIDGAKETLRRVYGALSKSCRKKKIKSLNLPGPDGFRLSEQDLIESITEGLLLPDYAYLKHKTADSDKESVLQTINWIGRKTDVLKHAKKILSICGGVNYARDLVNGNADEITPGYLADCARKLAKECPGVKATVFDKARIEKEKMGLLSAVNRGSSLDPAFIILEYRGNPRSHDHTVIVGKGVTYDTGGLNLKPTGGMETMKCDMAGGAACLGVILALSSLGLAVNVTAVIPSTENGIDAASFKPGDVYTSYSGKTVEMTNSDAEGRLILADALAYSCKKLKPTRLIDIATLTGAIEVALGAEATGLMSTDDDLSEALIAAGQSTFERVWRMPLFEEYKGKLKSDIADVKSWNGRSGSSSVAAMFLKQFVDESIPWAHLDIAGTAYVSEEGKYRPKYATGVGVRLLTEFFSALVSKS